MTEITKRDDVSPKAGTSQYGNVKFADEKNKKYPIDTAEHIRAAWNYISKDANAAKYSAAEVATIKRNIIAAWKDKIDKAGPPSAGKAISMKSGARHSSADQAHLDAAAEHLKQAGAATPNTDDKDSDANVSQEKALRLLAAAKAVPAGFDPAQYAISEAWDAATMAGLIPCLAQLLSSETYQQDPKGQALIQSLIQGASDFIASEVTDMGEGLTADATDDTTTGGGDVMAVQNAMLAIRDNPLKAISETDDELRVGNYIVLFGGRDLSGFKFIGDNKPTYRNPDGTSGTRFVPTTDFESPYTAIGRLPVDWEHGLYGENGEPDKDELLGYVDWSTRSVDDRGVFVHRVLNRRSKYMEWIKPLIEAGMVGTSSECVEKGIKSLEDGTITRWPLMRDTLTVSPAEPRMMNDNIVTALKALRLLPAATPGQADPDGSSAAISSAEQLGENDMTPEELKALRDEQAAATKAIADLKAQNDELLTELRKPALKTAYAQVQAVNEQPERPFRSVGEQMQAIKARGMNRAREEQINKLEAVKAIAIKATGANENIGSEGGDLVQTDFASDFFQRSYETGQVTARCTKQAIGAQFSGIKIPAVDEQSRADGSRWGGLQSYWEAEGAPTVKSKALFRLVVLELHKLFLLTYGTDELVNDAVGYTSYLNRVVPLEMAFKIEAGIIRGTGGGQMSGILNAPALVSVSKDSGQASATFTYSNAVKMYARMWAGGQGPNPVPNAQSMSATAWLVNQDVFPQLAQMQVPVGTGGSAVYIPPGGASGTPYGMLLGRPVIAIEQCSTLGTVGDVILADLSQYALADKGGLQAATSIHVQFLTDEMTFRWTFRTDGKSLWNTALTPFQGSNTQSPFIALASR